MGAQYYIPTWGPKALAALLVVTHSQTNSPLFLHEVAGLKFYAGRKSWIYALEDCEGKKSALVQITNDIVLKAVNCLLQDKKDINDGVWLGLERSIFGSKSPWKWISGENIDTVKAQWNGHFPVDPSNHHCGKTIWEGKNQTFKWEDADCDDMLPYICQGKLVFSLTPLLT